ncbi:MAG TPA: hypothetical protein VGJ55_14395 [Pyrinomonadaceae bacterium]|jgi:hypothetical protein
MLSQYLLLILAALLIYTASAQPTFAQSPVGKDARLAEEVKQNISRIGLGSEARARVKLHDKRVLVGYVSQVGADSFTLMDRRTGAPTAVPYTKVQRISGGNRSTGAFFSLPEPEPKEAPKWLKGVAKGATIGLGIVMMARLLSSF